MLIHSISHHCPNNGKSKAVGPFLLNTAHQEHSYIVTGGRACSCKLKSRLWHEHVPPLLWKQKSTRNSVGLIHHRHKLPSHSKQEPNSASSITTGLQFAAQAVLKSNLTHQTLTNIFSPFCFRKYKLGTHGTRTLLP